MKNGRDLGDARSRDTPPRIFWKLRATLLIQGGKDAVKHYHGIPCTLPRLSATGAKATKLRELCVTDRWRRRHSADVWGATRELIDAAVASGAGYCCSGYRVRAHTGRHLHHLIHVGIHD